MINVAFMGTPEFALKPLQALMELDFVNIKFVISQPSRKRNRKKQLIDTPIAAFAKEHDLNLLQPLKISDIYNILRSSDLDFIITCAYGQFIPKNILDIPKIAPLNIHGSLLPQLRGGAPIHKAIINGHTKTGVSLMKMISKMDAGPVYSQKEVDIKLEENTTNLSEKLSQLAHDIIIDDLYKIVHHELIAKEQKESEATFGYNITRADERIDWSQSIETIYNQIRGLADWPGAYTKLENNIIYKIYSSIIISKNIIYDKPVIPGEIINFTNDGILVQCRDGVLCLVVIQREGKTKQKAQWYYYNSSKEIKILAKFK